MRRRDGREVVVVSKEYYDRTKPSLKAVLQTVRFGSRGDAFDAVLNDARQSIASSLAPTAIGPENEGDGSPRHRRSE